MNEDLITPWVIFLIVDAYLVGLWLLWEFTGWLERKGKEIRE